MFTRSALINKTIHFLILEDETPSIMSARCVGIIGILTAVLLFSSVKEIDSLDEVIQTRVR